MFVTLGLALLLLFLFNLFVSGLLLYLAARLVHVQGARFRQALLIVGISALAQAVAWFAVMSVDVESRIGVRLPQLPGNLGPLAVVALVSLFVSLSATAGLLGGRGTNTGRVLAAWLLWGLFANV